MSLYIVDYSEKAIAIFGDTKYYKNKLNEIQGKFNASLNFKNENGETEKKAGWIFPKVRKDMVKQVINDINCGKIEKEPSLSNKSKENTRDENKNSSFESSTSRSEEKTKESSNRDYVNISSLKEELFKDFVPKRDFMNLVSKIEKLEQELFILKNKSNSSILNNSKDNTIPLKLSSNSKNQDNKDYEEELEDDYEEEEKPKKSLLRGKK